MRSGGGSLAAAFVFFIFDLLNESLLVAPFHLCLVLGFVLARRKILRRLQHLLCGTLAGASSSMSNSLTPGPNSLLTNVAGVHLEFHLLVDKLAVLADHHSNPSSPLTYHTHAS